MRIRGAAPTLKPAMSNKDSEVRNRRFANHSLFPWLVTLALSIICFGVIWIVSQMLR